ncbi:NAD-dependent epimerase/dehydratase family protein [Mycolicibacterium palauense]|uniref:NAD-dependent epimerase/dehydratase family protein n=1 Tax=Mycolicibacterium palauense TaxID=2034511 RepID=UPI000BFEFAC1|nr:NAD-dependent epimerase/dehydratase family protein [Mycolicibacterium palauense]
MMPRTVLVMGASGFVGSHVTRQLVERGDRVRVLLRRTSSTRGIDDLDVERHYGDIFDDAAVRGAMAGCEAVFYCVVDARAGLADPTPLFRTNVEGLRRVLDIAVGADLGRFVFLSTIGTIAVSDDGSAVTEQTPFNWADKGGAYIESRRAAEDLVLSYARQRGLPAVAMCVSFPYGPRDWQPTPHGGLVGLAARGRMPAYISGWSTEVVGVEDTARAMLLAAEKGRVGERYIVSESFLSNRELFSVAARETGAPPPRLGVPLAALSVGAHAVEPLRRLLPNRIPALLTVVRLMRLTSPADHGKATRELGWYPRPATEAIRRAARFHAERVRGQEVRT